MAGAEVQGDKEKRAKVLKSWVQNWQIVTVVCIPLANATYVAKLKAKSQWSILHGEIMPLVSIIGIQIVGKTQETLQNIFMQGFNNGEW